MVFGFGKKKKEKEFPEFPKLPPKMPESPRYESPIREMEEPEEMPQEPIPIRKPIFEALPPMREPIVEPIREEMRESVFPETPTRQPVYIKLSKYKSAVKSIKEIHAKLQEAEKTLAQILEIKAKEDAEIEKWREEITSIKNRLMEVDKDLFEA